MLKNLSTRGSFFYGDTIVSMVEKCDSKETTEGSYLSLISTLKEGQYKEGTITEPILSLSNSDVNPETIRYGSKEKTQYNRR